MILRAVEELVLGDRVSFRGSGRAQYVVLDVTCNASQVNLTLRMPDGDIIEATYKPGDCVMVHE